MIMVWIVSAAFFLAAGVMAATSSAMAHDKEVGSERFAASIICFVASITAMVAVFKS